MLRMIEPLDRLSINTLLIQWNNQNSGAAIHPDLRINYNNYATTHTYTEVDVLMNKINEIINKINEIEEHLKGSVK